MLFRSLVSAAFLSTGLFLAGCNSSDSPTANPVDPDPETDYKVNGTLTVHGKPFPAHVSGMYNDTSVTLTVLADQNALDTGWSLIVQTRPSQGMHPVKATGNTVNATYDATKEGTVCGYTVKSGSTTFDSWTPFMAGQYPMAKMSGSFSLELTRYDDLAEGCPDVSMTVSFTNAEAADWKGLDGVL